MKAKKQLEEKVFSYIREHHMLEPGDRVVAGISGGADSVCLLFVLLEWAKQVSLELAVVHVNHGIRKEAAQDAAYVERLCKEHQISFYLTETDVRQKAAMEKCSEEDAGRRVRYEAFARAAEEFGATKIAVAHNSNDRSETMLFHLFRGSGLKGLGSIQPVREQIIRPILCLERKEIETYLKELGLFFCQDATNATDDYTRNRIRHHILPYVEEHIVSGCVSHMAQTADMLSETEDYLKQQTISAMQDCVLWITPTFCQISVEKLLSYHGILQKRILHELVKSLSPGQKDISYLHITILLELFTKAGNRSVDLPFGILAKREYDKVFVGIVERKEISHKLHGMDKAPQDAMQQNENVISSKAEGVECRDLEIRLPEKLPAKPQDGEYEFKFSIHLREDILKKDEELPQNQYTKWFDYDKIKRYLVVRTRRTGDYLTIADGMGGLRHKSLKDYMIAEKIPRDERDSIPVLVEEQHVLWLVGYRISEHYKISKNTKHILQVQLIRKKNITEEKNG